MKNIRKTRRFVIQSDSEKRALRKSKNLFPDVQGRQGYILQSIIVLVAAETLKIIVD